MDEGYNWLILAKAYTNKVYTIICLIFNFLRVWTEVGQRDLYLSNCNMFNVVEKKNSTLETKKF